MRQFLDRVLIHLQSTRSEQREKTFLVGLCRNGDMADTPRHGVRNMFAQAQQAHVVKRGLRRHGIQSEEMPGGFVRVKEGCLRLAR